MPEIDDILLKRNGWNDFQQAIKNTNMDLYRVLSHQSIDDCCNFVQLEYGFGDLIVKDGCLQWPPKAINHDDTNSHLQAWIKNPHDYFLIVLDKPLEQFIALPSRVISLNIFQPGSVLQIADCQQALAEDFRLPWQLSAGMRTLFLLPKITDNMGYNRLRLAYQLTAMKPLRNLYDQWHIFRQIAQHAGIKHRWNAKLLLVRKRPNLESQAETLWQAIQKQVKKRQEQLRMQYLRPLSSDLIWQIFLESGDAQRFKPKSYLVDTIKHLYAISKGLAPGFIPASYHDDAAPITQLSQAFTQVYKLRNYFPTFMHLSNIEQSSPKMVYYSLAFPQLINHQPNHVVASTSQRELYELKQLIESVQKTVNNSSFDDYQLDYFHIDSNDSLGIKHSDYASKDDLRFMGSDDTTEASRQFCSSSIFWRGCIRLNCVG